MNPRNIISEKWGSATTWFCVAVTTFLCAYFLFYRRASKYKLPPGPRGAPLLGNLVQMVKNPHLKFCEWAREYGKFYTIYMANRATLVVNDVILNRELFGTMASTGKFKTDTLLLCSQGPNGIVNTAGSVWAEQRQFCTRSLRELGYGKGALMEPLILNEADEVCEWVLNKAQADPNRIVEFHHVLVSSTINSLWTLVTGERLKLDDSKTQDLWAYLTESLQYSMKTGLGFFPWLKYFAPKLSGYEDLDKACKEVHASVGRKFEESQRTYVEGQTRDLIDMYIAHMKNVNENPGSSVDSSFLGRRGWINSVSSVAELFMTGGETTSTTLKWAAVYLSHEQGIQRKLQAEIDEVLGRDRDPSLTDKTRMPFTEAVLMETLRLSSIVMYGVPHELLEDIPFQGYTLPKGLILMGNLYHIHHDPEIWGDPDTFRPERFLGDDGQRLKEYLVPFHVGKRQCLGEQLTKDVMFLFLVKLFQQFSFKPDPAVSKEYYYTPDVGILLIPNCTKFVISSR